MSSKHLPPYLCCFEQSNTCKAFRIWISQNLLEENLTPQHGWSQWDCWGPRAPRPAAQAARRPGRSRCALGLLCCWVLGADAYSLPVFQNMGSMTIQEKRLPLLNNFLCPRENTFWHIFCLLNLCGFFGVFLFFVKFLAVKKLLI